MQHLYKAKEVLAQLMRLGSRYGLSFKFSGGYVYRSRRRNIEADEQNYRDFAFAVLIANIRRKDALE
jgi:predicted nucleic acid-binding Zn ribbon protein